MCDICCCSLSDCVRNGWNNALRVSASVAVDVIVHDGLEELERLLYLPGIIIGALEGPAIHRLMGPGESLSLLDCDRLLSSVLSLLSSSSVTIEVPGNLKP